MMEVSTPDPTEDTMQRSIDKPWLPAWVNALQGLRPTEQAIGLHLAYFSDDDGMVDGFSWDELGERAGMAGDSIRKIIKREDSDLIARGLVERHERRIGNAMAMPLLRINVEGVSQM